MNRPPSDDRVLSLEHTARVLAGVPTEVASLRSEFHEFRSEMREFQHVVANELTGVYQAIREGDDETRRLMLALHEQVMARFDVLERRSG